MYIAFAVAGLMVGVCPAVLFSQVCCDDQVHGGIRVFRHFPERPHHWGHDFPSRLTIGLELLHVGPLAVLVGSELVVERFGFTVVVVLVDVALLLVDYCTYRAGAVSRVLVVA